jgi:hypothetical protein
MSSPPERIPAYVLKTLVEKLRPARFPGMPPVLAALVGFVIGAQFCDPGIEEIVVTPDGSVLARTSGERAANHLLGSYPEVLRSWVRVVAAAGLSQREFIEAQYLFALRVGFFGPTNA